MLAFITSRILQAVPVVLVVGSIAYATFVFVGGPVTMRSRGWGWSGRCGVFGWGR